MLNYLKPLINILFCLSCAEWYLKPEPTKCQGITNKSLEVSSNVGANILFPSVHIHRNRSGFGYKVLKKGNTYTMCYLNVSGKFSTGKLLGKKVHKRDTN